MLCCISTCAALFSAMFGFCLFLLLLFEGEKKEGKVPWQSAPGERAFSYSLIRNHLNTLSVLLRIEVQTQALSLARSFSPTDFPCFLSTYPSLIYVSADDQEIAADCTSFFRSLRCPFQLKQSIPALNQLNKMKPTQ